MTIENETYRNNRAAYEVTVPNQALCRVRVMGMISRPRHNQRSGVLDMNFSGFLRAHVEIRIHALAQES